jgi:hypothetical protein
MKYSELFRDLRKFWKRTNDGSEETKDLISKLKDAEDNATIKEKSENDRDKRRLFFRK